MTTPSAPTPPGLAPRSKTLRIAVPFLLFLAVAILIGRLDLGRDLGRIHVAMLSGAPEGNYAAVVDRLGALAAREGGQIENVPSAGSAENLARLAGAAKTCEVAFALVQAGVPAPPGAKLQLHGRLSRSESVFFLGKAGDKITEVEQLRGLRVDIGPEGSGTARLLQQIFESRDLAGLGVQLSRHAVPEALGLAEKGEIDLAAFVMDEDSATIESAVRDRGLQIAGFSHVDVVARRFPFLSHGRIGAGQFDAVRLLPPVDKRVLRLETLVVGNGCARRSQVLGLMTLLAQSFPDFVRHNHETPNDTGFELADASKGYFEHDGTETLDTYFPRLGDVMPPSNWVHVIMGVSLLFNVMGFGNRFRLWRVDAARVKADQEIARLFGVGTTLGDIARIAPENEQLSDPLRVDVEHVVAALEALALRCRSQSLSVLVPMGGEMAYRYQEQLILETIAVLRGFVARRDEAAKNR
ncbi:MAG: hypothetical protein ABJE95_07655 [Byssovorax sp.]